jgi:hypothetical protein
MHPVIALRTVKSLRLWLLLLLALLLPVRGAVAAAMLCPAPGPAVPAQSSERAHGSVHTAAHDDASHRMFAVDAQAAHDHDAAAGAASGATPDDCNLCSAFCSATPLLSSVATAPAVPEHAADRFPALSAPVPSFVSEGQDRPPRSA